MKLRIISAKDELLCNKICFFDKKSGLQEARGHGNWMREVNYNSQDAFHRQTSNRRAPNSLTRDINSELKLTTNLMVRTELKVSSNYPNMKLLVKENQYDQMQIYVGKTCGTCSSAHMMPFLIHISNRQLLSQTS